MNYKPEIGKIYDTIFYFIRYFYPNEIKQVITSDFSDSSFMDECFHEVEANLPSLPSILSPLFLRHMQTPTAMTNFFTRYIDFENDTLDSFLETIKTNSDLLYYEFIRTLFCNGTDEKAIPSLSPAEFIDALSAMPYSDDLKLQITLVYHHFDYVITVLDECFRVIYTAVDHLHRKYADKITAEIKQIHTEHNAILYKQVFMIDLSAEYKSTSVSISMLNQYISKFVVKNGNLEAILGLQHENDLLNYIDERTINVPNLLIAVGNDTRQSIINALMENGELTASAIAKIIHVPGTTVLRHIDTLFSNNIIFISRKDGLQIFYRINYDLLKKANELIGRKLNEAEAQNTPNEG